MKLRWHTKPLCLTKEIVEHLYSKLVHDEPVGKFFSQTMCAFFAVDHLAESTHCTWFCSLLVLLLCTHTVHSLTFETFLILLGQCWDKSNTCIGVALHVALSQLFSIRRFDTVHGQLHRFHRWLPTWLHIDTEIQCGQVVDTFYSP